MCCVMYGKRPSLLLLVPLPSSPTFSVITLYLLHVKSSPMLWFVLIFFIAYEHDFVLLLHLSFPKWYTIYIFIGLVMSMCFADINIRVVAILFHFCSSVLPPPPIAPASQFYPIYAIHGQAIDNASIVRAHTSIPNTNYTDELPR